AAERRETTPCRSLPDAIAGRSRSSDPTTPQPSDHPMNKPSPPTTQDTVTMEKVVALCKRRGFVFPSSEIYGGVGSTYDFGHYGVLQEADVKRQWLRWMLSEL